MSAALRQALAMLREQSREHRQREWLLRQAVWSFYAWTDRCLPFWRHGMKRRFPRAFASGDRTLIPRFDEVAQALAQEFPEATSNQPHQRVRGIIPAGFPRVPAKSLPAEDITGKEFFAFYA